MPCCVLVPVLAAHSEVSPEPSELYPACGQRVGRVGDSFYRVMMGRLAMKSPHSISNAKSYVGETTVNGQRALRKSYLPQMSVAENQYCLILSKYLLS
ncbi:hypothetical protein O9929_17475 [Vibrio lentus]|nr:hypothetical protein [Vibrio lentus]